MGGMFQETGKFNLHEAKHSRACRRKKRFLDVVVEELLMDNECHNLGSKGNFKDLIETDAEKSIENILNLLLVLELPEKRRGRKGNVVFIFGKFFSGVGKADLSRDRDSI